MAREDQGEGRGTKPSATAFGYTQTKVVSLHGCCAVGLPDPQVTIPPQAGGPVSIVVSTLKKSLHEVLLSKTSHELV